MFCSKIMITLLLLMDGSIFRTVSHVCSKDLLLCDPKSDCTRSPLCASNYVTYANLTAFKSAKVNRPEIEILHSGKCRPSTIKLDDIFISIKTSKDNEVNRLPIIVNTWVQFAKEQTWFFTGPKSEIEEEFSYFGITHQNYHVINTNCGDTHDLEDLCCKTSVEYDFFFKSGKKWFCHFDDDNYVNVPRLVEVLQEYNYLNEWYLGVPFEAQCRHNSSGQFTEYVPVRGAMGSGMCISKPLAIKMFPYVANGELVNTCIKLRCADDASVGYIIVYLMNQVLTNSPEFRVHTEVLSDIPLETFHKLVTLSYARSNVINIPGFDMIVDPTRFISLHCFLFPDVPFCPKFDPIIYSRNAKYIASETQ